MAIDFINHTHVTDPDAPATGFAHENRFEYESHHGLTKREYFAAMAMQVCVAKLDYSHTPNQEIAEAAVNLADALIAELNKPKP